MPPVDGIISSKSILCLTRWWFQTFLIFTPIRARFPFCLIFFRWVETTNKLVMMGSTGSSNFLFIFWGNGGFSSRIGLVPSNPVFLSIPRGEVHLRNEMHRFHETKLTDDPFLLEWPIFRGKLLVLGSVGYRFHETISKKVSEKDP